MLKKEQLSFKKEIAPYEKSNLKASIWQLVNTLIPLVALWYLAYLSLSVSYFLTIALAICASGFVIRTFIIFHDCCHGSFFKNRTANEIVGTIAGVLTFVPYLQWKATHSIHHATSSNLDKRGIGDVWVMTIEEYISATPWQRLVYRVYRNPFVMFGLGPIFIFLFSYRLNRKEAKRRERINTYITNTAIVVAYGLMCWAIGWQAFLMIQGTMFYVSGALGIWLFYVQHQFEDSYFENEEDWDYVKAAMDGSSYYKLPKILQWLTGNIGFHHVHHFSPRIPNYYLEELHDTKAPLQNVQTITLATSLKSLRFRLWDEQGKRFVSFRDIRHLVIKPAIDLK
ncbi:fatty acid desaturase [Paenibacillus eucommiae]|uniref:Omega-6 fatty acid desaturase (Delta-12 desaturase) n=1 Tax=Paenibacillus eucommiae TaxID=1355755 RepID=A0ABS4J810_9BACL|nr:fatty acid desaturase [Paenibacillus eucommiae]MBP1995992.1 omega-6 fatty acid desaturase (delta-12 desaturase) [Paenibacillus eucommiae]